MCQKLEVSGLGKRISRLHTDHFDALANSSVQVDKRRVPCPGDLDWVLQGTLLPRGWVFACMYVVLWRLGFVRERVFYCLMAHLHFACVFRFQGVRFLMLDDVMGFFIHCRFSGYEEVDTGERERERERGGTWCE